MFRLLLLYVIIGLIYEIYLIHKRVIKDFYYEFTIMDFMIAWAIVTLWPIIVTMQLINVEFSKVIFTIIKKK